MSDITSKTAERSPYTLVCFQECERMNHLISEMRRSLKELDLGLKVGWYSRAAFFPNIVTSAVMSSSCMCQRGSWPSPLRWRGCSWPCSSTTSRKPGPSWPTPPHTAWLCGACGLERCRNPSLSPAVVMNICAVPSLWFRYNDVLQRCKELDAWTQDLCLPSVVWLSGLFNPQSFLTGNKG